MTGSEELAADVGAVLAAYPQIGGVRRIDYLAAAGGMSGADLWQLHTDVGALCLRRWPREHPTAAYLAWIGRVLEHVRRAGFQRFPQLLAARSGVSWVQIAGRLWSLETWLPGAADASGPMRPARVAAALAALAEFHVAAAGFAEPEPDVGDAPGDQRPVARPTAEPRSSPGILRRRQQLEELRQQAARQLRGLDPATVPAAWKAAVDAWLAGFEAAGRFVGTRLDEAANVDFKLQPCLRDVWRAHLLFEGEVVTGIVDLAAMRLDHPATDIARLLGSIAGDDAATWQAGLAAYEQLRPLSEQDRQMVAAFDASGLLMTPWSWFRWVLIEGRQFSQPDTLLLRRVWEAIDRMNQLTARGGRPPWEPPAR